MQPHSKRNGHEPRPAGQLEAVQSLVRKGQALARPAYDLAGLFSQTALRRPNEAQARAPPGASLWEVPRGSDSSRMNRLSGYRTTMLRRMP